jgi:hypothetical protein
VTARLERFISELIWGAGALVVAWFVVGRARDFSLFSPGHLPRGVIYGGDSDLYMREAREPVWSSAFFVARQGLGGGGPFPFLLLVKLCRYHVAAVILAQGALWIAGFRYLARSAAGCLAHATTRLAVVAVVWALAVSAPLLQWTAGVGTEALSIVVTAVAIGAALRWATAPSRRHSVVLAAALVGAVNALPIRQRVFVENDSALVGCQSV